jgi:alkanesulfonate monooxygenase SsuD/methylene tetrahydromethanopterin reductase-like flavin-dependent oxidoreductase (luciferase family)
METATTALDQRKSGKATGHQKTSMMHLNELALLLSNLLEQMQNQQGGGSGSSMQKMMQKMKQMSGQQQKLNSQIQKYLNEVQGKRLSPDQEQRRKELARKQRQIKQQIQNMDVGSDARRKLMGDLQKIAEQMEQSAKELEQGQRPSRDLLDRQQQILTRLLNAQSSLRTQGKKKERTGQSARDDAQRSSPGQLPSADDTDQLRRDLIRALEMGYSSDYEALIKRYFELLRTNEADSSRVP